MNRLQNHLAVALLGLLGFILVFLLSSHGWSPVIVQGVLYATVFMLGFLGAWLGLGAVGKLSFWQSVGVATGAVLLVVLARR